MKQAEKAMIAHNLKHAALTNDLESVAKYAQQAFEAGHELEELGYTEGFFTVVANAVVGSGWAPKLTSKMIEEIETSES